MILSMKDFITWRINWIDKYKNIIDITKELNLGLDSVVFWDDNPLERDHVRSMIKEVDTIDVPKSVYEWPRFLKTSDLFSKFKLTRDDLKKKNNTKKDQYLKKKLNNLKIKRST